MVAISNSASVSSFDWKKGNLLVRKQRRVTPTDQMSRAGMMGKRLERSPDSAGVSASALTHRLVGTLQDDFWCTEASRACTVGSDSWPVQTLSVGRPLPDFVLHSPLVKVRLEVSDLLTGRHPQDGLPAFLEVILLDPHCDLSRLLRPEGYPGHDPVPSTIARRFLPADMLPSVRTEPVEPFLAGIVTLAEEIDWTIEPLAVDVALASPELWKGMQTPSLPFGWGESLSEPEIAEGADVRLDVEEEVGRLDVPMDDPLEVAVGECCEKTACVGPDGGQGEGTVVGLGRGENPEGYQQVWSKNDETNSPGSPGVSRMA